MRIRRTMTGLTIVAAAFAGTVGLAGVAQADLYDKCVVLPMMYVHNEPVAQSTVCVPWPFPVS